MIQTVVVDDDQVFLSTVTFALSRQGYAVTALENGRDLLRHLQGQKPDLILLDRVLPDLDGFQLCQKIKLRYPDQLLLMFSTKGQAEDMIQALELGADDYLPKPFPPELLLAKIKALLRHRGRTQLPEELFSDAGLEMDRREFRLTLDGEVIDMTRTEFDLLDMMLQKPGQLVIYREILYKLMGHLNEEESHQVLYFHMTSLRKKLGAFRKRIKTIRERGYRYDPVETQT